MKLSQKDFILISAKTNGRCFYCNKMGEEIDHFISKEKWRKWDLENTPIKGELNNLDNLFLSCKNCNIKKRDNDPEDFMGNYVIAWSRYCRTNQRVGLLKDFNLRQLVYGE